MVELEISSKNGVSYAKLKYIDQKGKAHEKSLEEHVEGNKTRWDANALLLGLKNLRTSTEVRVQTKSRYIQSTIENNWIEGWQKRNWKSAKGGKIANKDIWEQINQMQHRLEVRNEHKTEKEEV